MNPPAERPPALEVRGLAKSFGVVPVFFGVAFAAPHGRITAVLGPSGQGKTTLLRLIAGFERPDAGEILIDGHVVASAQHSVRPDQRGIGFVPQDGALFPHLDVAGNVAFGLERGRSERVAEMLALVGLEGLGGRRANEISGGQQQRVALARALAPSPRLLLLDEPFSALDASMRQEVREEVAAILRRTGTTTIMVTHDQQEAMSMADHVVVLLDGHVAQCGSPSDIYDAPASAHVAAFIGDANLLRARVEDGGIVHALGREPMPGGTAVGEAAVGGEVTVLVRPEQMTLVGADAPGGDGIVERRSYFGHDGTIAVRLASNELVTVRLPTHKLCDIGERVRVGYSGPARVFT